MKKQIGLGVIIALSLVGGLSAQSATEIIQRSRDLNQAKSTQMQAQMTVVAKDGSTSIREIEQYSVDENGLTRAVIVFKKPANVANTRFLVIENLNRDEDRWIYLPSLDKVRRIASGEGTGSFVGTDFTYDDISAMGRPIDRDTHTLLKEDTLNGKPCFVIESVPKKVGDGQYSRSVRWIDKVSFASYKAELFGKDGQLIKILELAKYETDGGYLTPKFTKMTNLQEKTSTTLEVKKVLYDKTIPKGVFTQDFLKTGRP
jgi:hypothetical protein